MSRNFFAGVREDATPLETISRFPSASIGREFVAGQLRPQDLRFELDRRCEPWLNCGGGAYLSYQPAAADVGNGEWAVYHRLLGTWLADHPEVALIVHHEPEKDMAGATFASLFNRARDEIKQGWAGARVVYCAMAHQFRPRQGDAARHLTAWQRVNADEYLVDVYSGRIEPATAILPEHSGFTGWFNGIVRPRLAAGEAVDWGLAERGFQAADPAVRAETIRRESAWLLSRRRAYAGSGALTDCPARLYVGWSAPDADNDPHWILDEPAAAEMRALTTAFATTPAARPEPIRA